MVGLVLGCQQGGAQRLGVDGGGVVKNQREREGSGRDWPRAAPSSSMLSKNDKGKGFVESLDSRERSPADPFPSLGQFAKENREKERYGKC
jgi:hypothetical protein